MAKAIFFFFESLRRKKETIKGKGMVQQNIERGCL